MKVNPYQYDINGEELETAYEEHLQETGGNYD